MPLCRNQPRSVPGRQWASPQERETAARATTSARGQNHALATSHGAGLVRRRQSRFEVYSRTAVWDHTGLPAGPIRWVLIRDPPQRFDPQALLCADLTPSPLTLVRWFVRRWQVEVTFQETRRHLGRETQRPWAEQAIARATPCLLALFSVVTLRADRLVRQGTWPLPPDAWYRKQRPTFADALAAVRQHYGRPVGFRVSGRKKQRGKLPSALRECLTYALCRAA
jgi:hypothetical protein